MLQELSLPWRPYAAFWFLGTEAMKSTELGSNSRSLSVIVGPRVRPFVSLSLPESNGNTQSSSVLSGCLGIYCSHNTRDYLTKESLFYPSFCSSRDRHNGWALVIHSNHGSEGPGMQALLGGPVRCPWGWMLCLS